ncbi:MAG: hypothetical protein C4617_05890 [Candidatus Liberibacter europaeus]|uniref:Uncharacterized protein n=1 Tax=Candidatus Liberibacter europaeus TaxID=744859 RepID=A0A2T4VW66_9HYPH|nr:hypothetical protein [Candidatus Liberibacter europaeus]PTL86022.1 MAG: hypothetical protein C4617_05890 [Candidatus Liberibacter europaeus]
MYYNTISEETIKDNIEEWKNQPRNPQADPKWYTGLGTELMNMPARAIDKLIAPIRPDDGQVLPSRSDPKNMGIGAHLVEGLTDLAPFWVGAQIAGRALSVLPTPITKIAGLALQHAPKVAGALYAYLSNKAENSILHQSLGVDKETADELAWRSALVHTSAILTPAAIASQSLAKTVASGAVLNIPFGMVDRGWSSKVLEDHGHSDMAKQYRIFDMEALMLDSMLGVFFGGMHSKQFKDTSLRLINDLKDGITDRLITKHANKSSSPVLHTNYEAHNDHMDTLAHGVDRLSRGEYPIFDENKLKNIAENSIEDPHFKSHLPELEPQPVRELQEHIKEQKISPPSDMEQVVSAKLEDYKTIDEHASQRVSELEKVSPELAKEVHEALHEEVQFSKLVKDNNLFQVAIDCFLRTGGH